MLFAGMFFGALGFDEDGDGDDEAFGGLGHAQPLFVETFVGVGHGGSVGGFGRSWEAIEKGARGWNAEVVAEAWFERIHTEIVVVP